MLSKLRARLRRRKPEDEWAPKNRSESYQSKKAEAAEAEKTRVTWLLPVKRIAAALMLLANLLIAAAALSASPIVALLFLINFWVCCEYLWKTRRTSIEP